MSPTRFVSNICHQHRYHLSHHVNIRIEKGTFNNEIQKLCVKALKYFSNDHDLDKLFQKLVAILKDAQFEFLFHALRGFLPNAIRPDYDILLENHFSQNRICQTNHLNSSIEATIKERENSKTNKSQHQSEQRVRSAPISARKLATKTDITNEIKNLSRDRSHLKQLRKKTAEEVAQRAKMKLSSDSMRRIKLQKLETEGFGFVIKGDKPVFISELKGGGAAQKAGIQVGDRLLAINDISVKNFDRDRIISMLLNSGENPVLTIQDKDAAGDECSAGYDTRLSRFEIEKLKETCAKYDHHGSIEALDDELTNLVKQMKPDRNIIYSIMQKKLPTQISAIIMRKFEEKIYNNAVENMSSEKFVKEMTKRERSASKNGTAERHVSSASSSASRATTRINVEAPGTPSTSRNKKLISSHHTEDGINYKGPEVKKVAAKKSENGGRRKQWSKSTGSNPFPTSSIGSKSTVSDDSLDNPSSISCAATPKEYGFQQTITRFDVEPPKPPSPERKPPLKPDANGAIRKSLKTNIVPIVSQSKARNISILIAHLRMTPAEIAKEIGQGSTNKIELSHLKTILRNKPDEKECELLVKRHQARAEMNEADQLAMCLINLSDYTMRLKCLIFKNEFHGRDVELKPAFECLTRASNQIKKSKKFLKIMEFISEDLKATLNKPNMKLKATMLDEYNSATNGSSAKSNLTNFIHVIQSKFPQLADFPKEVPDVKAAAKVNYSSLRFEIQRLRNECNFLIQQVDQMKRQNSNDKFPSKMKEYLLKSDKQIASVEILIQQSQRCYFQAAQYYGENPAVMKTEAFFLLFDTFIRNYAYLKAEINGLEL